ncbi:hypothetical protein PENTCL1PPCAC_27232, partial [Pristionchus entomophagus]
EESFVSILSIEKRLARDAGTSTSGDVSMEENGQSQGRYATTATSINRPLTAMVEPVNADATVAICYPRERPSSQSALMRASAFVFEKILLAEHLEDPSSSSNNSAAVGQSAAKRRRALSHEARERADSSRGGVAMREGRVEGEGTSLVSASSPPFEPALFNWGIYALPSRLWIGRRNVKRKLQKEHAGKEEIELDRWSHTNCSNRQLRSHHHLPLFLPISHSHRTRRVRLSFGCDDDEIPSIGR